MERDDDRKSNKIYISNLNMDTTEDDLHKHFEEYGRIVSVTLKQKVTGITFAFIEYEGQKEAEKAVDAMNKKQVAGKQIKVEFAKGGGARGGDRGGRFGDRDRGDRRDYNDRGPRRDFGNNSGNSRGCYNCGKEGHFARQCPEPRRPREDRGGERPRGGDRGGFRREYDRGGRGDRNDRRSGGHKRKYSSDSSRSERHRKHRHRSSSSRSRSR